eukprot:jgi/Psemu1/284211/fgenesh1_pg.44_\
MPDPDHIGLRNRRYSRTSAMGVGVDDSSEANKEAKSRPACAPENENENDGRGEAAAAVVASSDSMEPDPGPASRRSLFVRLFPFPLIWIARIAAVGAFVAGTILRTTFLHTGEECSMTYMIPVFLPVETVTPADSLSPVTQRYGLYKFVERRDPYYPNLVRKHHQHHQQQKQQQQQQQQQYLAGEGSRTKPARLGRGDHCSSNNNGGRAVQNHVVVYVPGHWGTYDQARSLGAHGIGLTLAVDDPLVVRDARTRILRAAGSGTTTTGGTTTTSSDITDFVYHVYALDFGEQGGALHGKLLDYQSEFLAGVLQQLSEDCGLQNPADSSGTENEIETETTSSLTIVAHSMGGTVARKVLVEQQLQQQESGSPTPTRFKVHQLITLATPHSNPLYAFDKSVADFYQKWLLPPRHKKTDDTKQTKSSSSPLVVSIVGGLRDEMIEPEACYLDAPNSRTIMASKLIATTQAKNGNGNVRDQHSPLLGMDHRAIVWCHQLLERVRGILWTLIVTSPAGGNRHRLESVNEFLRKADNVGGNHEQSFARDAEQLSDGLIARFGRLSAMGMEASMLYNLPYLLALYTVLVALKCAIAALPAGSDRTASSTAPARYVLLPLTSTIVLGWIARRETLGFGTTVIMVLVADSINFCAVYLFTLWHRRQAHSNSNSNSNITKRNRRSLVRILWYGLVQTMVFVSALLGGIYSWFFVFGKDYQKEFAARYDWLGLISSILYCGVFASIYVVAIVGLGFHNGDGNAATSTTEKNHVIGNDARNISAAFNIQLASFVMMVVPFAVAGPLTLMAWERHTQASSWWTLLCLQIPLVLWTLVKLANPKATRISQEDGNSENSPAASMGSAGMQQRLWIRSGLVVLSTLLMCCRQPGLLSRGTGYLVPWMAEVLLWIDIASSLLLQT